MRAAVEAVNAARDAGVRLLLDGDDLLLEASSPPPPAVLDLLREKKADIVALLRSAGGDWSAEDWQIFHTERAAVARFDGEQTEVAAREVAFECCVAEWLRRHPQRSDPGRCARCGEAESYGRVVVPFGTGRHVWLHHACWRDWFRDRREQARLALACLGIEPHAAGGADTKSSNDLKRIEMRLARVGHEDCLSIV